MLNSDTGDKRSPRQQRRQYRQVVQAVLKSFILLPIIGNALPSFADTYSINGSALNVNPYIRLYDTKPEVINWALDSNDPDQHFDKLPTSVNNGAVMLRSRGIMSKNGKSACLNGNYRENTRANAWDSCDARAPAMAWYIVPKNGGNLLRNHKFGLCLQMQNASNYGFNTMQPCNENNLNQKWSVNASTIIIPPSNAVQRAKAWVDQRIPYSQVKSFQGYRQDCSGLVSMAWGLPISAVTSTLPKYAITLNSKDQLQAGDAINNRGIWNGGHVVLFVKWVNKAQGTFIAYEQNGGYGRAVQTTLTLDSTPSGFNIREYTSNSIARPWYLERKR